MEKSAFNAHILKINWAEVKSDPGEGGISISHESEVFGSYVEAIAHLVYFTEQLICNIS